MIKKLPINFSERNKYLLLMKSCYKKAFKKEKNISLLMKCRKSRGSTVNQSYN